MDDVDAMPLDDDDVVDPDDPVLHTLPPRRGHLPLGLVEWMTAQELAHVVAVHPVFGSRCGGMSAPSLSAGCAAGGGLRAGP